MNSKIKIFGIVFITVLALAALGAGVAFAQSNNPGTGFSPGWMMGGNGQTGSGMMGGRGSMMGGNAQNGDDWEWMNAMHQWMTASGGMHTLVWNTLAEKLGLTSDELYAEVNDGKTGGKTITQIAEEKGVSRADLVAALETAHKDSLAQAVTDGALTQEQADNILVQMAGRYEWMLDHMGGQNGSGMMNGYGGMMGGRGGMMGGQYGAGGMMNGRTTNQQTKP